MRIICEDNVISIADESAILRSAILSDMHQNAPEGDRCVPMHGHALRYRNLRAWLTDD
jgi:hypothetical protein